MRERPMYLREALLSRVSPMFDIHGRLFCCLHFTVPFSLLLRLIILKFQSLRTALVRNFELNFPSGGHFLGCLHDAAQLLWIALGRVDPKTVGFFRKIDKDSGSSVS